MGEKNQEDWEATRTRMNEKAKMIDRINRVLRRKDLEEQKKIEEELRSRG